MSRSNLGPLLGVFFTGPAGLIVGALWGVVRSSGPDAGHRLGLQIWLIIIWLATLLYTNFMIRLVARMAIVPLSLQACVAACAFWLWHRTSRSHAATRSQLAFGGMFICMLLGIAVTLFPPVYDQRSPARAQSEAFLLDSELDASRHIPRLRVRANAVSDRFGILAVVVLGILTAGAIRAPEPSR